MSGEYRKEDDSWSEVDERSELFQRATPVFPLYSIILIVCLIGVSLVQCLIDGLEGIIYGGETSVLLAGFVKQFFLEGQYWRILTGAALHGGIIHLAFNCYALYILGRLIETLSNRAHLAMVFLLSALGGGLLSLVFLPESASVGASGGIVGFLGYLTVYGYKRRKLLPEGFLSNMLFNIGFLAFSGIILMSNVDNWGHLGGLLVGFLYGAIQIPGDLYRDPREVSKTTEFFGKTALRIFIGVSIFSILVLLNIVNVQIPSEYLTP